MKKEDYNLKNISKENPFRVPEGYMERLTARIMKQIPKEIPQTEPQTVSLMEKVRPFIYLAAMFAGLGLFFKIIAHLDNSDKEFIAPDSLLVNTYIPNNLLFSEQNEEIDEDEEYLTYIEDQYANALVKEELGNE